MFTGLIEEVGTIEGIARSAKSAQLTIKATKVTDGLKLGDSVATNGACLTVVSFEKNRFTVDAMAETMRRTNLSLLRPGSVVNLERALRLGDRLGGHMVSGHVDGMGSIRSYEKEDIAVWVTIGAGPEILRYVVDKGSVAIDGVSLTVVDTGTDWFRVSIIPHTRAETTLLQKKAGDPVNLECDIIGKYVEKLLQPGSSPQNSESTDPAEPSARGQSSGGSRATSTLSVELLRENGFI